MRELCGCVEFCIILSVFENEFGNHTQKMGFCIILSVFENEFGMRGGNHTQIKTQNTESSRIDLSF